MKTLFHIFILIAILPPANAADTTVSSIAQLQSAINAAKAGDTVILANGTYTNNTITAAASNIAIRAAAPGGVFLNGTNAIIITGNNITFSGFQFTSGSIPGIVIEVKGSNNTLTQLNFNGYSAQKYINLKAGSQHNTVTYSNFQNKPASAPQGNLIESEADPAVIGFHVIAHNSCQHMPGRGGDNGNECIRLGEGAQSAFVSRTVVEYNYFEDTGPGDSEAISVKSRENTLRWNTMNNNPDAMFVFRNGDSNLAYGNFFIASGGIRVKEANNIYCYNNYFERAGVGGRMNAVTYDYISPNLQNINFFHNTFVESGLIALAVGPVNNTWANNVFKKSAGPMFTGPFSGISWAGNMYSGTLGIAIASGMTSYADLGLALNSSGYFGLSSSSPAVNSGVIFPSIFTIAGVAGDYTLSLDVAGQLRDAAKDVGAIEYAAGGPATNRPLSLSGVGPSYLQSPVRAFNAAGYQEGVVAQDSIIALFGTGLADASVAVIDSKNVTRPAQLYSSGPSQINFLLPEDTATGLAVITIANSSATQVSAAMVTPSAPGIFTVGGKSVVPAAFYLRVAPDGQRTTDYAFDPITLNAANIPRASGDQLYLLLYGTGFRHAAQVTAAANGQTVQVLGAEAQSQFAGLDQVNIGPLPANLPTGMVTVRLVADRQSANDITVRLQ